LGAGYIASYHARVLSLIRGVELVAVCDQSLGRARSLADTFGIPAAYPSLHELLAAGPLYAVHVLLPPDHHLAAATELLEGNVSVLLEKPMATSAAACRQLVALAEQRGVRLGVGHNFLFAEPYQRLRRDLAASVFGPIDSLTVTWHKELGQLAGGPFDAFMLRRPENILIEIGPHLLSPVLDLVGRSDAWTVQASRPVDLPTGARFFRRWRAQTEIGPTAVNLDMALGPGFTEHTLHVRGVLAAATVDFERNSYVVERHAPLEIDFDRLAMSHVEAGQAVKQAWSTVADYVLAKAKLSRSGGGPYAAGILGAARAFYATEGEIDRRISAPFGRDVIAMCEELAEQSGVGPGQGRRQAAAKPARPKRKASANARLLVLGASGFIGRALVRACLAKGLPVRVLVRGAGRLPADLRVPGVEVVEGDIASPAALSAALAGVERVCHLARANAKTWSDYQRHEIDMTRQVALACLGGGIKRLVYTGTIDSYYAGRAGERITEDTGLDPQIEGRNLYARAKAASEQLLVDLHRERKLPLVIVRPGIVIGRGGSPFHWGVGMWRHNAVCQIWGNGRNPLPLVLVDDVVQGLLAALETPGIEGESFNLVGAPLLSAHDYLDALDQAAGLKIQRYATPIAWFFLADMGKWLAKVAVRFPERHRPTWRDWQSRTQQAVFDCARASQRLGWCPESDRNRIVRIGIELPAREFLGPEDGGSVTQKTAG
jgi:nucleoside-diphosphate-sugar epimerase/predicted dehydrogenase